MLADQKKTNVVGAFRWLVAAMGQRGIVAAGIATVFIALTGYLANQPAILVGNIVDLLTLSQENEAGPANVMSLVWLIVFCLVGVEVFTLVRKFLIERVSVAVQKSAFMSQVEQLLALRVRALNGTRTGELAIHQNRCVEGLVKLLKITFMELVPSLAYATVAIYFAFNAHILTGLVMMGVVIAATLLTFWQIRSQDGIRRSLELSRGKLGGVVGELTGALPYIRAQGLAPNQVGRMDRTAEVLKSTEMAHHLYMMAFDAGKKLIENSGQVLVILSGLYLFAEGELQAGGILTLVLLYRNAAMPLEKMHKVIDEAQEAVIRIGMLDHLRMQAQDPGLEGSEQPEANGNVPLVKFEEYNLVIGSDDKGEPSSSLDIRSLSIPQGQIVGIAGESGSGKSTFIQATMGLFPDATGQNTFLGCDMLKVDKAWMAKHIAYAPQRPFIIAGTLRENVTLNFSDDEQKLISDETLLAALQQAGVQPEPGERLIDLDLEISESGRNLSDGQCQRIGLSRIFLSNAELIVLDEATSALDTLTERCVIENLTEFSKGKTVLMIAHRLTTLAWADRILVFESGEVIQDGCYDVLSGTEGRFAQLLNPLTGLGRQIAAE